jgi:hypothetical protein
MGHYFKTPNILLGFLGSVADLNFRTTPHEISGDMSFPTLILHPEHERIEILRGSEPKYRYFRIQISKEELKEGGGTITPSKRNRRHPRSFQYIISLHLNLPTRKDSEGILAIIPMDQFAASTLPDAPPNKDLIINIPGSLGDEPRLNIDLKIKKRKSIVLRSDKYWPFITLGD